MLLSCYCNISYTYINLQLILHRTWVILILLFYMLSYFGMNSSCLAYQTSGWAILALSVTNPVIREGRTSIPTYRMVCIWFRVKWQTDFYVILYHTVYLSYLSLAESTIFCRKNILCICEPYKNVEGIVYAIALVQSIQNDVLIMLSPRELSGYSIEVCVIQDGSLWIFYHSFYRMRLVHRYSPMELPAGVPKNLEFNYQIYYR